MQHLSRRQFLASTAAASVIGATPSLIPASAAQTNPTTTIRVDTRVIEVNGRPATVFGLTQPGGTHGLITRAGEQFRVKLENRLNEETLIHWHGLTPPWQQDGVPNLSQAPLGSGGTYDYDFPLARPGTNWMHSHHGLQEQRLMAAPLIVRDPSEANADVQEVVVLFHDFSFRNPDEILAELRGGGHGAADRGAGQGGADRGGMDHSAMGHSATAATSASAVHLNDVNYDAFLANDRTFDDPNVFRVERGGHPRPTFGSTWISWKADSLQSTACLSSRLSPGVLSSRAASGSTLS